MQDYQGNSRKQKEAESDSAEKPKKELEKVVSGDVKVRHKTVGSKFKDIFFGGDFSTAWSYVVSEVLLPALRNLAVESVSKGADRLIYGEAMHRRRMPTSYGPRVQYHNPFARPDPRTRTYLPDQPPRDRWTQGKKSFEDLIVASKQDADALVERLIDIVDMYDVVSVADLNELVGLPSAHTDNKWGWTNLSRIEVRQVRDGYQISFPPTEEI